MHADAQLEFAHRCLSPLRIGRCDSEVAAHRNQHADITAQDLLDALDDADTHFARWLEAERIANAVEQRSWRTFVDADRAIALHVAMTTNGTDARARLADIPAQQEEVRDLLHVLRAVRMLRDAHAIRDDGAR